MFDELRAAALAIKDPGSRVQIHKLVRTALDFEKLALDLTHPTNTSTFIGYGITSFVIYINKSSAKRAR